MPRELRRALIYAALEQKCEINLDIYCNCDSDQKSGSIPFGLGFPTMPWYCQKCGNFTEKLEDLLYDFEPVPGTCFIKIVDHFLCRDMVFEVASYKNVGQQERLVTTCGNSFFLDQFEFVNYAQNR